jgi:hypothetical protein
MYQWILFAALVFLPGIQTTAQNKTDTSPQISLPPDARLERQVSVSETGIPLEELLNRLSDKNLSLTCSRSNAPWKLHLRLKDRSLRTLMQALAELLPGEWIVQPDGSGYRLDMERKATERRARWWELFLGERDKALAAQRQKVLAALRRPPVPVKIDDSGNPNLTQEAAAVPQSRQFYNSLPADLQEHIADRMNETAWYRSMVSVGGEEEGAMMVPLESLPESCRNILRDRIKGVATDPDKLRMEKATVTLMNEGIRLMAVARLADGRFFADVATVRVGTGTEAISLLLDHTALAEEVKRLGNAAPEIWKTLAKYQTSRIWKNSLPAPPKIIKIPPPRRAEILAWLAKKADIEFVADYYSVPGQTNLAPDTLPLSRPVTEELDARALEQDFSWKRSNTLYLIRSNRWYRDDFVEIPEPTLKRWRSLRAPDVSANTAAPNTPLAVPDPAVLRTLVRKQLDWEAEVVQTLSPWQIANGLKWAADESRGKRDSDPDRKSEPPQKMPFDAEVLPFFADADRILQQRRTLLFYGGLTADERERLLSGSLVFDTLTPAQKEQVLYLLPLLATLPRTENDTPVRLALRSKVDAMYAVSRGVSHLPVRLVFLPPL